MHRLSKAISGLVVGLQRLDALVFTGGIGENSAVVRSLVLRGWVSSAWLRTSRPMPTIAGERGGASASPAPVLALVVPTDEELLIARDTARVISAGRRSFAHATPVMS